MIRFRTCLKRIKLQVSDPVPGYVGLILILFACACQRIPNIRFSIESVENPEAGELIRFINETKHATAYRWEFGDGGVSHLPNPKYSYEQAGIYKQAGQAAQLNSYVQAAGTFGQAVYRYGQL